MVSINPRDLNIQAKLPDFMCLFVSSAKITEYPSLIVDFKKFSRLILKALQEQIFLYIFKRYLHC